jgi:EAL domain-containing protein (putative c-di-GMP-specific phosphodiesterase class I)
VLREACRTASGWDPALHIGVNVSGHQLSDHLVTDVRAALVDSCLDPSRLWIEVTETALAGDAEAASRSLTALSELGVNIALDDFGTGYSSLARLRAFPLTVLKIDRTFVQEGGESVRGRRVLAATVELAHAAGLMVVAEGVETAEQLEALRAMGCDYSQGFLHSRPVPAEELEVHVRSHVEAMA